MDVKGDIQECASAVGEGGGCTAPSSGSMIIDVLKPTVKLSPGGTTVRRRGCGGDFKMNKESDP